MALTLFIALMLAASSALAADILPNPAVRPAPFAPPTAMRLWHGHPDTSPLVTGAGQPGATSVRIAARYEIDHPVPLC